MSGGRTARLTLPGATRQRMPRHACLGAGVSESTARRPIRDSWGFPELHGRPRVRAALPGEATRGRLAAHQA